ncbi:MAG: S8 family peptidase [Candidatus Acidiferrales bacterium]
MKRFIKFLAGAAIALMAIATNLQAQNVNNYVLQSPSLAQAQAACHTYGFKMLSTIHTPDTYLVQLSAAVPPEIAEQWVKHDPNVEHLELDDDATVPEVSMNNSPYIPAMPVTTYITDSNLIKMYGSKAWVGYVQQPAIYLMNLPSNLQPNKSGTGIVAIIDTGVDPNNAILAPALVPGYDFTRNISGSGSELSDLNQSTAAILEQSTAAILEQYQAVQLNQSTAAILEQSTAAILEGQKLPAYFGHGTMVAGLVHLVAPSAKIMPLKAFKADGSANNSDIVRAIYYATDHGARVINMSFSMPQFSDAMMRAVNYATRHGVICVASVGNEGQAALVYPASLGNVLGVASTSQENQQSAFSNYGADLVALAAPGEALITTYPGPHYAAVWGTSFSSALVAGSASLLLSNVDPHISPLLQENDVRRALSQALPCSTSSNLGAGCLSLGTAMHYIQQIQLPHN